MYTVSGYTGLNKGHEYTFDGFVKAITAYRKLSKIGAVIITRDKRGTCLWQSRTNYRRSI